MNEDEILSAEEVMQLRCYPDAQPSSTMLMYVMKGTWSQLCASHEALRAQCEAERQARLDAERMLGEASAAALEDYAMAQKLAASLVDAEAERDAALRKVEALEAHNRKVYNWYDHDFVALYEDAALAENVTKEGRDG